MVSSKELIEDDIEKFYIVTSTGVYILKLNKKQPQNASLQKETKFPKFSKNAYGLTWSNEKFFLSMRRGSTLLEISKHSQNITELDNPDSSCNVHQCIYVKERNSILYASSYDDLIFEYDIDKKCHKKLIDIEDLLKKEKRKKTEYRGDGSKKNKAKRVLKTHRLSHVNSIFYKQNKENKNLLDVYFLCHNCGKLDSEVYVAREISKSNQYVKKEKIQKLCSAGRNSHNVFVDKKENIYFLDSLNGNLVFYDSIRKKVKFKSICIPKLKNLNWLRGLSVFDKNFVIGCSYNFSNELSIPTEEERSTLSSLGGIIVLNSNLEIIASFTFKNIGQIYEIRNLKKDSPH
jgi:hypothetical protein